MADRHRSSSRLTRGTSTGSIERAGEALTVTVLQPDGSKLSVQAVFDAQNKTLIQLLP